MCRVVKEQAGLKPKQWVRIKRGVFKDDLAQVDYVDVASNQVTNKLSQPVSSFRRTFGTSFYPPLPKFSRFSFFSVAYPPFPFLYFFVFHLTPTPFNGNSQADIPMFIDEC